MTRESRWLRETYVDLLLEYAKKDPRIVLVEADLAKAAGTNRFQQELPDRMVNVGIAEASMISTAAGMAAMGKLPFTHTFTAFSSRRVCDQVTLSVAYAGLKVVIVGSDPGVTAELNGGTHMSMEDMAIMRNIPGMLIYEPVDSAQLRLAFPQILAHGGPVYIRLLRRAAVQVYDEASPFQLGKGVVLREGRDVSVFATGIMVAEALEAARLLEAEGISAEIINIHTLKPLDRNLVLHSAKKTGAVVTAENHSVLNALGSAVAEVLAEECPVPLTRVGVRDHFGEVGSTEFLQRKYGLTAQDIVQAVHSSTQKREAWK